MLSFPPLYVAQSGLPIEDAIANDVFAGWEKYFLARIVILEGC